MSFDSSWEENIYSQKKHINRYPYGELVSIFFNSLQLLATNARDREDIKVLEIGSGTGNNLWFIAQEGFKTYSIDGSRSACKIASELCKARNVKVDIQQAYFDKMPFDDESMDIIIDREATYCGTLSDIKLWWQEANRVLKKGGLIISFKFSDTHPDLIKIKEGILKAQEIEANTYKNIESGSFHNTGIVHFSTYDELFDIFSFCDIKLINANTSSTLYNTSNNQYNYAEWIIVGVKK